MKAKNEKRKTGKEKEHFSTTCVSHFNSNIINSHLFIKLFTIYRKKTEELYAKFLNNIVAWHGRKARKAESINKM